MEGTRRRAVPGPALSGEEDHVVIDERGAVIPLCQKRTPIPALSPLHLHMIP